MRALVLVFLSLPATAVLAETGAMPADPMARAKELREQSAALRNEAETRHAAARQECLQRFLVNACQAEATDRLRQETARARDLDRQSREIEREFRKREFAEREARRMDDLPARETAAAARAEKNRLEAEEARQRVARKQAEAMERQ
jgi:hypothetical protein